jgi:hypothetical protein
LVTRTRSGWHKNERAGCMWCARVAHSAMGDHFVPFGLTAMPRPANERLPHRLEAVAVRLHAGVSAKERDHAAVVVSRNGH